MLKTRRYVSLATWTFFLASLVLAVAVLLSARRATIAVSAFEYGFTPHDIQLSSGRAEIVVHNNGILSHSAFVQGLTRDVLLEPGTKIRFKLNLRPGAYKLICTVPGHEMESRIMVTE